jgi:hypothetical protein
LSHHITPLSHYITHIKDDATERSCFFICFTSHCMKIKIMNSYMPWHGQVHPHDIVYNLWQVYFYGIAGHCLVLLQERNLRCTNAHCHQWDTLSTTKYTKDHETLYSTANY